MAEIAVVGTDYDGTTMGTCFSRLGHRVPCVDNDAAKFEGLRDGHVPIVEAGLDELVTQGLEDGLLRF